MSDWPSYLDIVRAEEEEAPLPSSSRLLTTTTTTPTETDEPAASLAGEHPLSVTQREQGDTYAQNVGNVPALPERAEPAYKARTHPVLTPQPAADVAGGMSAP